MPRTVVTLAVAVLLLTGCSSGGSDSSAASPASADALAAEGSAGGAGGGAAPDIVAPGQPAAAGQSGALGQAGTTGQAVALGRVAGQGQAANASVIRTGELEVVVDDVSDAAGEIGRLVQSAGGQVEADDRATDGGRDRAVLRLRVPPRSFDTTVSRVAALGEERTRRLGSEDVTDQVVDLASRLDSQRASVERVRALLSEAKNLGEVVQVEAELTRRTADLESLQARLAALSDRVELASLSVRLTAADSPAVAAGGPLGFGDGLRAGWEALRAAWRAAGVAVGAVLPWSPVLLITGTLLWRARRRTGFGQAPLT